MRAELPQHLRGDPEGDLREPRLHQHHLSRRRRRSRRQRRSRSASRRRLRQPRQPAGADRARVVPRLPRPARPQPAVPERGRQDAAGSVHAPLRPMPLDPLPALSTNELDALRKWIEVGAPRDGTVAGTAELLDACLPPHKPIEIDPLPPPPAGDGRADPHAALDPRAAERARGLLRDLLRRHRSGARRRIRGAERHLPLREPSRCGRIPLSHHLIVNLYEGAAAITDPVWGGFKCRGGATDGQACDPDRRRRLRRRQRLRQRPGSSASPASVRTNLPGDAQIGLADLRLRRSRRKPRRRSTTRPACTARSRCKGIIIWNSHAFNLTDRSREARSVAEPLLRRRPKTQQFPAARHLPRQSRHPVQNGRAAVHRPRRSATSSRRRRMPQIFELSSHMHQRGKRWRTFDGAWQCQGGANDGAACSPFGPDAAFETDRSVRRRTVHLAAAAQERRLQRRPARSPSMS